MDREKNVLMVSVVVILLSFTSILAGQIEVLRPGGILTQSDYDTLSWRTLDEPSGSIDFASPGDSLAVWFNPAAPCSLLAIRFYAHDIIGDALIDVWDGSRYDGHIATTDSTDSNGWIGDFENGNWIPGRILGHSPIGWSKNDTEHHIWGSLPLVLHEQRHGIWTEIPADVVEPHHRVDLGHTPFLITITMYPMNWGGMAAENEGTTPYHTFKYYNHGEGWGEPGPDGEHFGWFIHSASVWIEAVVKYYHPRSVSISGSVSYYSEDIPVDDVKLVLSGEASDTTSTDADGTYRFVGLQSGLDYCVTPGRNRDDSPISAFDASLIHRHIVDLMQLDEFQMMVGDVTRKAGLTSLDASTILRYIIDDTLNIPSHSIGTWSFIPDSMFYGSLTTDQLNQDYTAFLCGDVSGNWRQTVIPDDTVIVWLPEYNALPVVSSRVYLSIGDIEGLDVFSAQCEIIYDESVLKDIEIGYQGTAGEFWGTFGYTIDNGKISMVWAGVDSLKWNGPMAYIDFQVSPDAQIGQTSPLRFGYFMFNEGDPWAETKDGMITIVSAPDIAVSDTIHDFRQAIFGSTKDWILTLSNVGIEDLIVFALLTDTSAFRVDRASFKIPPDCSENVNVTFAPTVEGRYEGTLTIISNDPDEREVLISLHGTGAVPYQAIEVSPTNYDFGEVAVNGVARTVITVTNIGTEEFIVSDITSSNDDFSVDKSTFTLQPDSCEEVIITCSPTNVGSIWGKITLYTSIPDGPIGAVISVKAEGVLPEAIIRVGDGYGNPGTSNNEVSIYLENGEEIGGLQFILNFDPDVLEAIDYSSTARCDHMDIIGVNLEYAPGQIKLVITGIGQSIASGTGSVIDFFFDVVAEAPFGAYPLTLTDVKVADIRASQLLTGIENGQFYVGSQHTISGTVTYREIGTPVDSVQMRISDGAIESAFTDDDGHYQFGGLQAGLDYVVTPNNTNDDTPVSALDASFILRHLCNQLELDETQVTIADVTGQGGMTAFDAATILEYIVHDSELTPSHFIGVWSFIPDSLVYDSLSANQTNQDYMGLIIGDVSGNWRQTTIPEDTITVWFPQCNAAPGESIRVFVNFGDLGGLDVYSAQGAITYDQNTLTLTDIGREATIYGGIGVIEYYKVDDGNILIAWAGNEPPEEGGTFVSFDFYVSPDAQIGQTCPLHFEQFMFNEGDPFAAVEDGSVKITATTGITENDQPYSIPSEFALFQNYPNPFNVNTDIRYQIVDDGYPVQTTLKIYNIVGQEVRTLLDTSQETGYHSVAWDGKDGLGGVVPSGVYFYRFQAGGFTQTKRMLLLK